MENAERIKEEIKKILSSKKVLWTFREISEALARKDSSLTKDLKFVLGILYGEGVIDYIEVAPFNFKYYFLKEREEEVKRILRDRQIVFCPVDGCKKAFKVPQKRKWDSLFARHLAQEHGYPWEEIIRLLENL